MLRLSFFSLAFSLILTSCCSSDDKEFNFDNNETKRLDSYHAGDTIYFQNAHNDLDTLTILSVDSAKGQRCAGLMAPRPSGKSCWVTIKHLPIDKWHFTTWEENVEPGTDHSSIQYWKLIHITKDPQEKKVEFGFHYRDFVKMDSDLVKLSTDTLAINKKTITNYYFIDHSFPDRLKRATDIETIIWTDNEGLTAYKNKGGDWWTRK